LSGHRFLGWFAAPSGGEPYTWNYTLIGDVTMHAQWRPEVAMEITINDHDGKLLELDKEIPIIISKSGDDTSFTATVNGDYYDIQWYLNGDPIDGDRGTASSIRINARNYPKGNYYLGVSVTSGRVYYSRDICFTVTD
jgi:membrane carboxypeptidase/penicillin-binding protein PbpC